MPARPVYRPNFRPLFVFTYVDYNKNREVMITIEAESISDADTIFELQFGKHPRNMPYVGCSIKGHKAYMKPRKYEVE